ncbi:MAG TPA: exodeoxyribonuclease V subunit alpha [Burkholderiales bacterium]|nr:exodeoxyribonuclease V subunit alpha [Burkholderiales bacterium]
MPAPRDDSFTFADVDLHFARLMTRLAASERPELALAAALASRATGEGDVCVRLADFAGHPFVLSPSMGEREAGETLIAPALDDWTRLLREHTVVGSPNDFRPLVLDDAGRLYLYRYWDYEKRLAEELLARAQDADGVDETLLRKGLARYFPNARDVEQRIAAAMAVMRRLCVISGGPGTGKTTTVVKILALLAEQAGGRIAIGLAAPTGKAAARVQDAIRAALETLDVDLIARPAIPTEASTVHRLLGARPDSVYYRHDRDHPLSLDVLVVDEASMADLALAVKLLEALPRTARVILLGDKDQLASVEAGAVLGDVCRAGGVSAPFAKRLAAVTGVPTPKIKSTKSAGSPLADSIALLETSYRFGPQSGIGTLARLVNAGEGAGALELLEAGTHGDIAWRAVAPAELKVRLGAAVVERLRPYYEAVRANETPEKVFGLLDGFRVLCAHRRGLFGVTALNRMIEDALDAEHLVNLRQPWYAGRPVMITRNDYGARLFNGDVGIMLPDAEGHLKVFFRSAGEGVRAFAPARLPEHETVYAMTIHKSQGSEFGDVLMVLPNELSPIMSRELVYTGITRARDRVEIWGSEAAFTAAVERRLVRASALQERLWGA